MKHNKVFALDYDGVICDSLELNLEAVNETCKELDVNRKFTQEDLEQTDNMTFEALWQSAGLNPDQADNFIEMVYRKIDRAVDSLEAFPSMMNVIPQLDQSCRLAIVTCNDEDVVRKMLKKAELLDFFPIIMGNENRSKAEKLTELVLNFKTTPDQVYMVGDCVSDIQQAREANVKSVAATWGYHRRQTLMAQSPDFIADAPLQLVAIANDQCPHSQACPIQHAI